MCVPVCLYMHECAYVCVCVYTCVCLDTLLRCILTTKMKHRVSGCTHGPRVWEKTPFICHHRSQHSGLCAPGGDH